MNLVHGPDVVIIEVTENELDCAVNKYLKLCGCKTSFSYNELDKSHWDSEYPYMIDLSDCEDLTSVAGVDWDYHDLDDLECMMSEGPSLCELSDLVASSVEFLSLDKNLKSPYVYLTVV